MVYLENTARSIRYSFYFLSVISSIMCMSYLDKYYDNFLSFFFLGVFVVPLNSLVMFLFEKIYSARFCGYKLIVFLLYIGVYFFSIFLCFYRHD